MNIPSFWVRERREIAGRRVHLRGMSELSLSDAQLKMEKRARLWQNWLTGTGAPGEGGLSGFLTALRNLDGVGSAYSAAILEPVVERLSADDIVTRNRYGCLVLNTTNLCIVDVDRYCSGFLVRLFTSRAKEEKMLASAVRHLCEGADRMSARLYRTAHGWRVILQEPELAPGSEREMEIFAVLHADPMYVKLCRSQACWRARLSPKPFHRGLRRYPRSLSSQDLAADWVAEYEKATAGLGVCRLVETFGSKMSGSVLERHDRATGALVAELELA